jgi:CRISPR-associated protein Cas2
MALNETRTWLIAYDIADPRRLARVHRYLKSLAVPAQYSLWVATETARGVAGIRNRLAELIHPREDDVRIYQLPARTRIVHYGRRALPEGLLLVQAGAGGGGGQVWKSGPSGERRE